jgi:Flp pilus assembly protein TadG
MRPVGRSTTGSPPARVARHGRAARRQRGAAMVEFALVANLLLTLALGVVEYGFAWRSSSGAITAVRAAARTVSSLGTSWQADEQALTSLRAGLSANGLLDDVELVVIYRSTTTDGAVPAACKTNLATAEPCNIFTGAELRSLVDTDFDVTTGCHTATLVRNYCPNARVQTIASADYVGVWVKTRHTYITGLFGSGVDIRRSAVMRMEPRL